jgi:hypothetical protein
MLRAHAGGVNRTSGRKWYRLSKRATLLAGIRAFDITSLLPELEGGGLGLHIGGVWRE